VLQSFVLQSLMSDVIQICDGNTMPGKLLQKSIAHQEWRQCCRPNDSADAEKFGGIGLADRVNSQITCVLIQRSSVG
jgi:hypothetical protein